uniref:Uncharacterized protein n=1 Tax=Anguilla anguilla TaxID=7936 RepID=A0A0E9Q4P9_ANGAN
MLDYSHIRWIYLLLFIS